jgi:hypothetical protein
MYMTRPPRALGFAAGVSPGFSLREASAMAVSSAALFLLGDFGMALNWEWFEPFYHPGATPTIANAIETPEPPQFDGLRLFAHPSRHRQETR